MEFIIGVVVSLFTEGIKKYAKTDVFGTYVAVLVASVGAAFIYVNYSSEPWFTTFLTILTTAGGFYAFVIRRVQ